MKYHFAHLNKINVVIGQKITKGDVIGLMGRSGTKSVHLHFEIVKVFRGVTDYTRGLSRAKVLEYYENPYNTNWRSIAPFSHLGWDWLSDIGGGQLHPGIDINSGVGDSDLNTPIKSPINGVVYYANDDTNSGWGKHIFIDETNQGEQMSVIEELQKACAEKDQTIIARDKTIAELQSACLTKDSVVEDLTQKNALIGKDYKNAITDNVKLKKKLDILTNKPNNDLGANWSLLAWIKSTIKKINERK